MIIFRKLTALLRIVAAAVVLSSAIPLAAQTAPIPLINNITQFSGLNAVNANTYQPGPKEGGEVWINQSDSFVINLNESVELTSDRGLVVYLGRYNKGGDPTVIEVTGSRDGENFEEKPLGYAYLMYRGSIITHEFSNRIFGEGKYKAFRFKVIGYENGLIDNANVRFFKFNLYVIGKDENYPNGRKDPIRMASDYYMGFKDYTYEHNSGILDTRNHYGYNADYPENTPWGENNVFYYEGEEHELPTFHKQGGGQMPHIIEHTLYAMPGDVIPLIPFYDLATKIEYKETFSHWYGYNPKNEQTDALKPQDYHHVTDTDGNRLLDFLVDPSGIVYTEENGYFAGTSFPRSIGTFVIKEKDDLKKFSELVNKGGGYEYLDAVLANDIDCTGLNFMIGGYSNELKDHVQYKGTFDGNGHTLSNYNRVGNGTNYYEGMFAFIGAGCTIRNLIVKDAYVSSGGRVGGLVGGVGGNDAGNAFIENVLVTGDVRVVATGNSGGTELSYGGGIVGIVTNNCSLNMNNVGFIGTVDGGYGDNYSNGALVGRVEYGGMNNSIINCFADAQVGYVRDGCGMYYSTVKFNVKDTYSNVLSTGKLPVINKTYGIHQGGMANEYPNDEAAFHIDLARPEGKHYVRVEGISENDPLWPAVYINIWGGSLATGWPGIKLEKGDGFYYTYIEDCGESRMMINNGNDGNKANPENTSAPCFSAEGNDALSINFSKNAGNYVLKFNGHLKNIDKSEETKFEATEIRVAGTDKYIMVMIDGDGKSYTKPGADRTGGEFSIFDIPESFRNKEFKYSIVKYDGRDLPYNFLKSADIGLPQETDNMGHTLMHRIFVKKPTEEGWDNIRIYEWAQYNGGTFMRSGTVNFDGEDYLYFDLPSNIGAWSGITFENGNGQYYRDAIRNPDSDMKIKLTLSTTPDGVKGRIEGSYFNPLYFEYVSENPDVTIGGETYTAGTVTVNGRKFNYINLAPSLDEASQYYTKEGDSEAIVESLHISKEGLADVAKLWKSYYDETFGEVDKAQFYATISPVGNPTVYLNNGNTDFYDLVKSNLGFEDYDGIPCPPLSTVEVEDNDQTDIHIPALSHGNLRWYGTSATFYQPLKTDKGPTDKENIHLEREEYHIAADFAHEFNPSEKYNLERSNKTIHEPIINYRHIFHVKDGAKFAEENTATKERNEVYLKNNSRAVSARAGYDFQIRLNTLVPTGEGNNTTNFYYKKSNGEHSRVPRVKLEIKKMNPTGEFENDNISDRFIFEAAATSQGTRMYPDKSNGLSINNGDASYSIGDGNSDIYRIIYCSNENNKEAATYQVRLVASDGTNNIKTADGLADLYLEEFIITFLPKESASVLTEDELMKEEYRDHRASTLEDEDYAGAPAVVIDYDQYRTFESAPYKLDDYFISSTGVNNRRAYKWPVLWQKSSYSFGYGGYHEYDYNEYIIANHSSEVTFHESADHHQNQDGSTGLYDRLWYDTYAKDGVGTSGYFYYVNAASDPGILAKLTINNLCPGSTVAVSAWAAEMSNRYATANFSFNFVAVDKDGNSETVHTFVTGFIDNYNFGSVDARAQGEPGAGVGNINRNHGEWMHIYYSFIPDLSNVQTLDIDHYELWLENNCVSSDGADYAVDDIRAYIIAPSVTARQLEPVCDAKQETVGIRISSRFDKLLDSNGLVEKTDGNNVNEEKLKLHFVVLDKKKYDTYANKGDSKISIEEIEDCLIKVVEEDNEKDWTTVEISNLYANILDYNQDTYGVAGKETVKSVNAQSQTRYIRVNILPKDVDLRPGKDYYIVLYAQSEEETREITLADFAIDDQCAKYAVMTVQGSGVIKIDGIAYNSGDPIEVCAGQSPVVQVDLKMLSKGDEIPTPSNYDDYLNAPDHYYDWYNGSIEEFMATENGERSLYDLLYLFRYGKYSDGTSDTDSSHGDKNATALPDPVGENDIYQPLRDKIKEGKLVLHASSFVFPPLVAEKDKETIVVLTAMPILPGPDDEEGYKVCSQPNEIRLRVQNNSPLMYDGFAEIKDYPTADVPLRVGLTQINDVSKLSGLTREKEEEETLVKNTLEITKDMKYLELPLRNITSYKGEGADASMTIRGNKNNNEGDPFVYLAETNDPAYIGLDKHPGDKYSLGEGLLPIGMMEEMDAKNNQDNSFVTIVFDDKMKFREGYYYRVRFSFDENLETEVGGYCQGQVVFTLKVVPEYMKWTGADSRNWNNDANWSRVTADELLLTSDASNSNKINNHTIAEANDNRLSYAPLDFTKVVVPDLRKEYVDATVKEPVMKPTEGYPWMFDASSTDVTTLNGARTWNNKAVSGVEDAEGVASENIEYDMTSLDFTGKLACRPWYANTCEQIHFNHGAELLHQESFLFDKNYKKAWVDMEMAADRWYTLGSPLQGVVAGDMYTKSKRGKQDNELFTDINFNTDDYGRYAPAVYQRGWNKSEANTYFLGDGTHDSKSAAVELNWSRVYNDVEEAYTPGTGFSIRTDSKTISEWDEDVVRFRLPKADNNYSYFDPDKNTEKEDYTTVKRPGVTPKENGPDERHSLVAFTKGKFEANVTVGKDGSYFLVGNPFIASMNMGKFLKENEKVIEQAYWIITDERQEATLWDEKSGTFLGTDETEKVDGVIAPMQGFFVKAKTQATALTLTFTPEMIVTDKVENAPLLRSEERYQPQVIRVSALNVDGDVASRALINIDPIAQADYVGSEDAALLIDRTLDNRATVYTVASEQALAINSLDAIVETEVGLLATEGTRSTLMFEGIDDSEGLLLLDTADGSVTDLYNGMTVDVEGSASGRFYITRPAEGLTELALAVVIADRTVSVVSGVEGITARVYTPAGLCVGEWSSDDTSLQFDLESGIFIVEAVSENQRVTRKFVVK